MKRIFTFTWNDKNKIERHNTVIIQNASEDIGKAAGAATKLFCKNFGNLHKIEIVSIQELNENYESIGEPIVPINDTSIVPTGR